MFETFIRLYYMMIDRDRTANHRLHVGRWTHEKLGTFSDRENDPKECQFGNLSNVHKEMWWGMLMKRWTWNNTTCRFFWHELKQHQQNLRLNGPKCPGTSIKHCEKKEQQKYQQDTCPDMVGLWQLEVPDLSESFGERYWIHFLGLTCDPHPWQIEAAVKMEP